MNEFPLLSPEEGIPLFYPFIPPEAADSVVNTLQTRWVGQGPKVDQLEVQLASLFSHTSHVVATGSGTDALHLAYLLADVGEDDEVITPVFTCTATNLPILYQKAIPVFADIDPSTFNIDLNDIEHRITPKTKAIVAVDYGGIPCDYPKLRQLADKYGLKLIADCAQSIGATVNGMHVSHYADFVCYSFQAIKTITCGDGGALVISDPLYLEKAKRLRWFGIDRSAKQKGVWENDILEVGYKYQMTDISASILLASLPYLPSLVSHRQKLFNIYASTIKAPAARVVAKEANGSDLAPWLCTIVVPLKRVSLMHHLRAEKVESAQVHYRNDRYTIFGGRRSDLPHMDLLEDDYLVLPLHHKLTESRAYEIADTINEFLA